MREHHGRDEFEDFVAARQRHWLRTAYLLCGHWQLAEDLVQQVLERLYVVWPKVRAVSRPDAYVRKSIVNAHLSEGRRPWRRERFVPELPDALAVPVDQTDDRVELARALRTLPPRQRIVLVLRFWEDLSVAETAEVMGCAPGTVKSQTSEGLRALRLALGAKEELTK
ncbi:SigE family RNA polymerase sigma factor [Kribbella deserti]|uniref:SigE family RNA polymerase sigma factor n=1 Tax=Kribbella deserti TaxID=1926257 RepID=A0ABV6QWX5_9ACTN